MLLRAGHARTAQGFGQSQRFFQQPVQSLYHYFSAFARSRGSTAGLCRDTAVGHCFTGIGQCASLIYFGYQYWYMSSNH
jgi:hypothetical protein